MKRYLIFMILLFLLIPFVSAQDNSTLDDYNEYYVGVDGNLDGDGSIDNPFSDIRTAISKSSSNDVIYLKGGIYSGINNTNLDVPFSNLTIKSVGGEKVIIDANKTDVFTLNENYFNISNITFINAYSLQGSCFNIWSRHVTISDCNFFNDASLMYGGAIYIRNNYLTVNNCNFINCSAFGGGAMHIEGAQNFISNCNFINCSAVQSGAINWQRKSSYLYNATFINCHALDNGGVMSVNENTVVFDNITAINCSAGKAGAVIYGNELKGTISNSVFINNSADSGAVFQVFFDSDITLVNSTLLNNKASSSDILFNISINNDDVEVITIFKAKNNMINAFNRFTDSLCSFSNVTYWGIEGVMNSGEQPSFVRGAENIDDEKSIYLDSRQANQPITIEVYDSNDNLIRNVTQNTGILGNVSLIIYNLSKGSYSLKVYHPENEYYGYIMASKNFEVSENNIKLESYDLDMYYKDGSKFVVNLTDNGHPIANASVNIEINNVSYIRFSDENGLISMAINLDSGGYEVFSSYVDAFNKTYNASSVVIVKPTVDASNLTKIYKNDSQFYAIFCDSNGHHLVNTSVTFNINGVFYNRTTNSVGVARLNINLNQGNYTITSINTVTGEKTSNLICVIPSISQNKNIVKYYRNDTQYSVFVCDGKGNAATGQNVTFNINGVFYTRQSNESGYAKLNINLQPGDYIITAEFNGCTVSNNITVLPVLSASDLTKDYGSIDQFVVKLVDGVGNLFSGQNISFNINGIFYDRLTDNQGLARLNINLQPGKYLITSSYNQSNIANWVTVI